MPEEIYNSLIQFGGGTAIIVALYFLIREVGKIWLARRNGDGRTVDEIWAKIKGNHMGTLERDVREMRKDFYEHREDYKVFKQKVTDKIFNTK